MPFQVVGKIRDFDRPVVPKLEQPLEHVGNYILTAEEEISCDLDYRAVNRAVQGSLHEISYAVRDFQLFEHDRPLLAAAYLLHEASYHLSISAYVIHRTEIQLEVARRLFIWT